jgi:hypothetical protein
VVAGTDGERVAKLDKGVMLVWCAERIILASISALLSPVQDGKIWRVKIVWPNGTVHYFGRFTSE